MTVAICLLLLGIAQTEDRRPDLLLSDFEGGTFGKWASEGKAFGEGPTVAPRSISGYRGDRLAASTGKPGVLTSPSFKLERRYLNFLIAGDRQAGAEVRLIIEGRTVRTASPPEEFVLLWQSWDVGTLVGREGTLQIVDSGRGKGSPLKVDHVIQSDQSRVENSVGVPPGIVPWRAHVYAPARRMVVGEVVWVGPGKVIISFKAGEEIYRVETMEVGADVDVLVRGVKSDLTQIQIGDEVSFTLDEQRRVLVLRTSTVVLDKRVAPDGSFQPDYAGAVVNAFKDGRTWMVTVRVSKRTGLIDVPFYLRPETKAKWLGIRRRRRTPQSGMVAFVWLKPGGEVDRVTLAAESFLRKPE